MQHLESENEQVVLDMIHKEERKMQRTVIKAMNEENIFVISTFK